MGRFNSLYNPNIPSPYKKRFADIYNPKLPSPYKRPYDDIYNPPSSSPYMRESNPSSRPYDIYNPPSGDIYNPPSSSPYKRESNPRNNRVGSGTALSLKREVNYYIKDFLALADDYANLIETIISSPEGRYAIPTVLTQRFNTFLDSLDALEEAKREDMDADDSLPALATALSCIKGLHGALMARVEHPKLGEAIRAEAWAVIEQARADYQRIRKMTSEFGGVSGSDF